LRTRLNTINGRSAPRGCGIPLLLPLIAIVECLPFQVSCASLRLPASLPSINHASIVETRAADVRLTAVALSHAEQYLELFDDNLPEIGLVATRIIIKNESTQPLIVPRKPWALRIGDRQFDELDAQSLLKSYYEGRQIRMFTVQTDETARLGLLRLLFTPGQIPPHASQDGLAFFKLDAIHLTRWPTGAALISQLLAFADGRKISLELNFSHATP
jgi:hypothetical protein